MDDQYVHGSSGKEQQRLALMNRLINASCLKALEPQSEKSMLDIGCGTGEFTRLVAKQLPAGAKVVAIERDPQQLATAIDRAHGAGEKDLVSFRLGDALSPPLQTNETGQFELAHTRFLLEHVQDPQTIVTTMVQNLKPGGRIVLADDDHDILRLWPEPPHVMDAWRAYFLSYLKAGHDPYIGRKLVSLIHKAGATPTRNQFVFYGACAGMPEFPGLIANLYELLAGAAKTVVGLGKISERDYAGALMSLRQFAGQPDATLWYAINWAEGIRQ